MIVVSIIFTFFLFFSLVPFGSRDFLFVIAECQTIIFLLLSFSCIEGQIGKNLLYVFLLRAHNQGPHKDREKGSIPSKCFKEACFILAKGGNIAGENGKKSISAFFLVFQGSVPRQRVSMSQVEGFGPK